jgi:Amt family ammonium transporter
MTKLIKKISAPLISLIFLLNMSSAGMADTTVSAEVGFIFNTLLFLICGFLVMFMACGFAMLESGMVTSKSVSVICAKNIGLFSIAGIMFWLVGYNLAYGISPGGYIGKFIPWADGSKIDTGYSDGSDWYFQMVFCATTVSIVSGTMAERIKLWPFFTFAAILSGIIYPIVMGWQWGGGWLAELGFSDFAGSTLVHSTGGAAALAGAMIIGPRLGRFTKSGAPAPLKPFAASSIPLVTIGVFILWLGWFGFNGGSQLALGTATDAIAVSKIFINTFLAGAGGVMGAAVITRLHFGKTDVVQMLNGCIGGLVAVTAEPLVGAIPAHLFAGIWGTLIVPATNSGANFSTQLIGVLSVNIFVFIVAYIVFSAIKATIGLRLSKEGETKGTDVTETGVIAYAIRD